MAKAAYIPYSRIKGIMSQAIIESARDEVIRRRAFELIRGLEEEDDFGQLDLIFLYVRDGIRYIEDPAGEDLYQSPEKTMQLGFGDCNNKVALLGSLARSIGFPVRTCWAFLAKPEALSDMAFHVWAEVDVSKSKNFDSRIGDFNHRWVACETTPGPESWGRRLHGRKLSLGQSFTELGDFPAGYVEKILVE